MSSLHYLLTEYCEPLPTCSIQPYKVESGSWGVQTRTHKLPGVRGRTPLSVTLTFPNEWSGPIPTFVLSPGLGAHPTANRYLERHLASHGYLVARPSHRGSDWIAVATRTPLGAFTRSELGHRVREMESVIFALESGELGFLPAEGQMALGGHSFGALTACVLAGLPAEGLELQRESYSAQALVALSPYGDSFPTRSMGIDPDGFSELSHPVLFMSGTRDELFTLGKGSKTHLEPFKISGAQEKRHVVVGKTRHGSFSEIFGWVRKETRVMVNSSVAAFLDTHLLDNPESREYLETGLALAAFEYESWAF